MIDIRNVSKIYPQSTVKALDDVSLCIESGEFFGLLGPNGAGKTTLISILSTLLLPTAGEVRINGEKLTRQRQDIKRKLSLITQHNSLRNDMTPDEIMELQARLYFLDLKEARKRSEELLVFLDRRSTVQKRCVNCPRYEAEIDALSCSADSRRFNSG